MEEILERLSNHKGLNKHGKTKGNSVNACLPKMIIYTTYESGTCSLTVLFTFYVKVVRACISEPRTCFLA